MSIKDENITSEVEEAEEAKDNNETSETEEAKDNTEASETDETSDVNEDTKKKRIRKPKKNKDNKENKKDNKKEKKSEKEPKKPEEINIVKELLSLIIYIGLVVLLCYFVINFVGCRSRVDGSSMNPTLEDGDNLWVDKLSYRFGDPKRFDVIIFNYDEDTTYVKRIIGLPGETVRIDQDGHIFINEQLLKEDYGKEVILPTNLGRASQPVVLGEDEYFVLGDNRNNSQDSRWADVGNVNRKDIVGKVILRIYPFSKFGTIKK